MGSLVGEVTGELCPVNRLTAPALGEAEPKLVVATQGGVGVAEGRADVVSMDRDVPRTAAKLLKKVVGR